MNLMLPVLILTATLASCAESSRKDKSTERSSDATQKTTVTKLGNFEFQTEKSTKVSSAEISNLVYDSAKHSISLSLKYSGCKLATHSLIMSEACAESYPRQCGAAIVVAADYVDKCDAVQEEKLSLALTDAQDEMVLFITNKSSKGSSVLIDRSGKVKAATTPP